MKSADGDEVSAEIIKVYRETIHPLYRFVARRAGGSQQLAEDVTQEAYLRAVAQWRDGRRPESPLAWLQTVARNLLLSHYRRKTAGSLDASRVADVLESSPVDEPDTAGLVYWGLARVGCRARRLLEAFYIDGQSIRMIATELGVSERAIEGRLRRARQTLRSHLRPMMRRDGEMS